MFILLARYKVKQEHQKKFIQESKTFYFEKFKKAKGFRNVKFLRNILDKDFIDIMTEWESKEDFYDFINTYQKEGVITFSIPVETSDRFLYETIE